MKAHITKRYVDSLKPAGSARVRVYDDHLTGFGVIVHPSGSTSFFVEYGPENARRRMTLGRYGPLTVEAARGLALAKLAEIAAGGDPLHEREARRAMPTFGAWALEYVDTIKRRKKQPREDERFLTPSREPKKHGRRRGADEAPHTAAVIADRWRNRPLDEITRRDVEAGMAAMAERGHTSANRWLASVRACFSAAVKSGVIKDNPALAIRHYREAPPRARVLTDEEFARVVALFDGISDPFERVAFVVLMDTGARKSEVLRARWEDIDLDGGLWRIPSPKSGRPQVVPLAPGTVGYLRSVPRVGPWLVPGRDANKPRQDLRGAWDRLREGAELEGVTIHDLRRTFGLHVARKAGLHIASKLLRHSDIRVTERVYVPLGLDETRAALADMHEARGKVIELARKG